MKNIVLIGAGNIGSRHLQALKAIELPLKIYVVDKSPDSLSIAKQRYDSIPAGSHQHEVSYSQKIENYSTNIDLSIIATNSNTRREIIEEVLDLNNVTSFILEKILFQKAEDYYYVEKLFQKNKCQAWVNCTRRMIEIYKDKIKELYNKKKISFIISGSNWGLISNSIHYIDYIAYLLESTEFKIDTSHLDQTILPSKRDNYNELSGVLNIRFKNGSRGIFTCSPTGNLPIMIEIVSETNRSVIHETNEKVWRGWNQENNTIEEFQIGTQYISNLTTINAGNILKNNTCDLPSYKESMRIHLSLLNPLLEFINKYSEQNFSRFPFT